jgi:predicted dehydrogenase
MNTVNSATTEKTAPFALRTAVLIGAGRMGRSHAQALRNLGGNLTAMCDVSEEARGKIGTEFSVGTTNRFAAAEKLFEKLGPVDLVLIATTADSHARLVQLAAAAGAKSILCEKPLATSVADCDAMIAACAASGTRLAVNHQMRFMDQYRLVKEEFATGALGRLASMTVVGGCMGLAMNGSHYIEAFNYLTGARPREVTAWFTGAPFANPRGPAFFDQAGEVRVVADSGQRFNLMIGHDQGHGMTATYAGAYGHVFVDELQGEMIVTSRRPEHREQPPTRYGMPWDRRTVKFPQADNAGTTQSVIAALASGQNYPSGEDARRVIAVLAACYASHENGHRPVAVDALGEAARRTFPWA